MLGCCCRRRARAAAPARETTSTLERELQAVHDRREAVAEQLARLQQLAALAGVLQFAWPAALAALLGGALKVGAAQSVARWWHVAAAALAAPLACCGLLLRHTARRVAALLGEHAALDRRRAGALERAKSDLPMAEALALLMRHDPDGDHRLFIECPPHLQQQIDALRAEREELRTLADGLLALLGSHVEGGWGVAGQLLRPTPLAALIARLGPGQLPASAQLLGAAAGGGGVDGWLLAQLVATPAPTTAKRRGRTPGGALLGRDDGAANGGQAAAVGGSSARSATPANRRLLLGDAAPPGPDRDVGAATPGSLGSGVGAPRTPVVAASGGGGIVGFTLGVASALFTGGKPRSTSGALEAGRQQHRVLPSSSGGSSGKRCSAPPSAVESATTSDASE